MYQKIRLLIFTFYTFLATIPVYAAEGDGTLKDIVTKNFQKVGDISELRSGASTDRISPIEVFGTYLSTIVGFLSILFIVEVIHGGFLWMTAGGNEEQITKARHKVISGAIGAGIILSAYIVTAFIIRFVGESLEIQV
ncbi:MAG: hypothetical protein WC052_00030 [Patescibacteria group bacterium]|jgi:hypothetical protein